MRIIHRILPLSPFAPPLSPFAPPLSPFAPPLSPFAPPLSPFAPRKKRGLSELPASLAKTPDTFSELPASFADRTATLVPSLAASGKVPFRYITAFLMIVTCFCSGTAQAIEDTTPIRELYVPFEDLPSILSGANERIFMPRAEFELLKAAAATKPAKSTAPRDAMLVSADYEIRIAEGYSTIVGLIDLDIITEGVVLQQLEMNNVRIRNAVLDDEPAAMAIDEHGMTMLVVQGIGRHRLRLDMFSAIESKEAQQTLQLRLPTAASNRMRLLVQGNVELKSGAAILQREFDTDSNTTRFEIVPSLGPMSIVVSLNNKQIRDQHSIVARSVMVDEITPTDEKLVATFSMNVMNGGTEHFEFLIPAGFEVQDVVSPQMTRWNVEDVDGKRKLDVTVRETVTRRCVIGMTLTRPRAIVKSWEWPRIEPLDVAGHSAVLGLRAESRLQVSKMETQGLIALDDSILANAIPSELQNMGIGAVTTRLVGTFYAPQAAFQWKANFESPTPGMATTTSLVLRVNNGELELLGGLAVSPSQETVFALNLMVPKDWQVLDVTSLDGTRLVHHRYDTVENTRVHITLAIPIRPSQKQEILFTAKHTPKGWLDRWEQMPLDFPKMSVLTATQSQFALAVQVDDDLSVESKVTEKLTPMFDNEKAQFRLEKVSSSLAFQTTDEDWKLNMQVTKTKPRVTARWHSFFAIRQEGLSAHYEATFDIERARTGEVAFSLPVSTPSEVSIAGIGDIVIKETSSVVLDARRIWTVKLVKEYSEKISLSIDFQQPFSTDEPKSLDLPQARAENVVYQSGVTALEGDPEFEFQIEQHPSIADVGELVDAKYQVGKHLLGTFGYLGTDDGITISVERRSGYLLPSTIVTRAELTTIVSDHGISQTAARYSFQSKDEYLEIVLPDGSQLWSIVVDGVPSLPQLDGDRLVIEFPKKKEMSNQRDLQIVYQMPIAKVWWRSRMDVAAPKLIMRQDGLDRDREVPMTHIQWNLWVPKGNKLVDANGSVFTKESLTEDWIVAEFGRELNRMQSVSPGIMGGTEAIYDPLSTAIAMAKSSSRPQSNAEPTAAPSTTEALSDKRIAEEAKKSLSLWALAGVRSLPIEIKADASFEHHSFASLGDAPRLSATFIALNRSQFAAWLTGLLVFVGGVLLAGSSLKSKWRYLFMVLAAALLLPVLTPWTIELQPLCLAALFAIGLLLLVHLLISILLRWIMKWIMRSRPSRIDQASGVSAPKVIQTLSLMFITSLIVLNGFNVQVVAQPPAIFTPEKLMSLIEALPSKTPISIPLDTVVIPYRLDQDNLDSHSAKPDDAMWIAMPTYVDLWNRANPQKPLNVHKSPVAWAWRGVEYSATIEDDAQLRVKGLLLVENFSDDVQTIPLTLQGGVLKRATLDDKPAQLEDDRGGMQILVARRGIQTIMLDMSFPVQKQGGWRILQGSVPVAPASQVTWTVAKEGTEMRFQGAFDRIGRATTQPSETFMVPLANDGSLSIQWRPKVAEATVDQGLSSDSTIFLDVQEDGLRLDWKADLSFRTGRRDAFRFELPADYLVERVIGTNIRGWNVDKDDERQRVDVQLLKSVAERESITIIAARRSIFEEQVTAEFDVPVCRVEDAMLQQGTLVIRRSSLLDIRAENSQGFSRRDMPTYVAETVEAADESPLGLKPFQAFRFATVPYSMKVTAEAVQSKTSVETQTILRLSTKESSFESLIICHIEDRSLYRIQLRVPEGWKLERPNLPCDFEWSLNPTADGLQQMDIRMKEGQKGDFSMILLGRSVVAKTEELQARFSLPEIQILNVNRQEGNIVIQTDPGYDVRLEQLQNCETALMSQVDSWLDVRQRPLARMVVHYRSIPYSVMLQIVPRTAVVNALAISNVKVTDLAIEETVYIDWTIRDAGIHQFSFTLPAWMRDSRIRAPLIQKTTKTPLGPEDDSPIQFVLDLQDDVIGQYRVVIENDRPIASGTQLAPIPDLKTGITDHRYVTLENVGDDELTVGTQKAVTLLDRLQSQWKKLSDLLGGKAAQAYWVQEGNEVPILEYSIKDRTKVKTAQGRIGLAQTLLIVDEAGAYRASQEYRVENRTEQYLEIEMPSGASLWTAEVAGEPVKPIRTTNDTDSGNRRAKDSSANATTRPFRVRIPLIKTDEGDLDYGVVVKYGGRLSVPDNWKSLQFPLIRTVNMGVELSQVRLLVPESRQWYGFGGTLGRVDNNSDFAVGWFSFKNKQIEQLTELLSSNEENSFSKSRAAANLKSIESEVAQNGASVNAMLQSNPKLQSELLKCNDSIQKAQTVIASNSNVDAARLGTDNRITITMNGEGQYNTRANSAVQFQANNFQGQSTMNANVGQKFDQAWIANNGIVTVPNDRTSKSLELGSTFAGRRPQQDQQKKDSGAQLTIGQNPTAIDLSNSGQTQNFSNFKLNETVSSGKPSATNLASRYQQAIEQKQQTLNGVLSGSNMNLQVLNQPQNAAGRLAIVPFANGTPNFTNPSLSFGLSSPAVVPAAPVAPFAPENKNRSYADQTDRQNGRFLLGGSVNSNAHFYSRSLTEDLFGAYAYEGMPNYENGQEQPIGYQASLSLQLNESGREYLFTTPRGKIELSARSFSGNHQSRLKNLGLSLLLLGCLWYTPRLLRRFTKFA